jgi:hypothetical protein
MFESMEIERGLILRRVVRADLKLRKLSSGEGGT